MSCHNVPVENELVTMRFLHIFDGNSIFINLAHERFGSLENVDSTWFNVEENARLPSLEGVDVLVCHSLSPRICDLLNILKPKIRVWWIGFGYDYYDLIFGSYSEQLLWPTRLARYSLFLRSLTKLPRTQDFRGQRAAFVYFILDLIRKPYRDFRPEYPRQFSSRRVESKVRTISNYVSHFSPGMGNELTSISSNYRLNLSQIEWNYGVSAKLFEEPLIERSEGVSEEQRIRFAIGNSATWENNHLAAINVLKNLSFERDWRVVLPLATGYDSVRHFVTEAFRRHFGEKQVEVIFEEVGEDDFVSQIRELTSFVSLSKRQLGLGTIKIALYLGKKVVLRGDNPVLSYLRNLGFAVTEWGEIESEPSKLLSPLQREVAANNSRLVTQFFGDKAEWVRTEVAVGSFRSSSSA